MWFVCIEGVGVGGEGCWVGMLLFVFVCCCWVVWC